jgi:hypothetical protein
LALGNYLPNSGPDNCKSFGRHHIRKPEIITIMLMLGLAIVVILVAQEGLDAETALALALIKRARELLVGLPGLGALLVFQRDLLLPAAGSSQKSSWQS